ncbi:hypothetical protein M427DRAFT_370962 [Gonapodya prolifera JEL478]|uniref:Uncharacterized protein n=1 Tax=Gonapodya prolifera (strain JEL478) TaxID=1344416 RepID=A0A139AA57_GONPJ|nr:hypothetical protein M427DRAFT_370962 [Gonapodya prolifera JEL478]|eukprot:KXS13385.1 hypothetical protein M427DRAFT_370962 [Gonapodya prolifera JEL478]
MKCPLMDRTKSLARHRDWSLPERPLDVANPDSTLTGDVPPDGTERKAARGDSDSLARVTLPGTALIPPESGELESLVDGTFTLVQQQESLGSQNLNVSTFSSLVRSEAEYIEEVETEVEFSAPKGDDGPSTPQTGRSRPKSWVLLKAKLTPKRPLSDLTNRFGFGLAIFQVLTNMGTISALITLRYRVENLILMDQGKDDWQVLTVRHR